MGVRPIDGVAPERMPVMRSIRIGARELTIDASLSRFKLVRKTSMGKGSPLLKMGIDGRASGPHSYGV